MIFGLPVVQLLLFGYAIDQDVRHLRAAVADQAGTARARGLVADAEASQVVDVVAEAPTAEDLETLLRQGQVSVGILIPRDFERRAADPARPNAQLLVDGSDPIVLQAARSLAPLPVSGGRPDLPAADRAETFAVRAYYNPERRSEVKIVPGLIGVILTMTMVLFTAVAIVRERERGNLELLITTPVRTDELMIGKVIPYLGIGLVQVTLILALGVAIFDVPVRGGLVDLYVGAAFFVAASLGVGLLLSTLAQTQFQAFQMTIFFFLPSLLLSGFMFPFDGMPRVAQLFAELLPLTHFVRVVRGVLLRGASLADLHRELWPMLAFFAAMMTLAVLRFRKRLD